MSMNGYITLHSTEGQGFAKKVKVREGMTVGAVFAGEKGTGADDSKYRILLNGEPASANDEVSDGDRVIISPANIKGA